MYPVSRQLINLVARTKVIAQIFNKFNFGEVFIQVELALKAKYH